MQTAHTNQEQKNKRPNQKVGRKKTKQLFLQRRHTDGEQTHEKMLNTCWSFNGPEPGGPESMIRE